MPTPLHQVAVFLEPKLSAIGGLNLRNKEWTLVAKNVIINALLLAEQTAVFKRNIVSFPRHGNKMLSKKARL